jgi:hypothetical protein
VSGAAFLPIIPLDIGGSNIATRRPRTDQGETKKGNINPEKT